MSQDLKNCVRCCAAPPVEGRRWCAACIAEDAKCLYCEALAGDGHHVCETCDRRMRDQTRTANGLPPFTNQEYAALRQKYGRAQGVLVVNGGRF